jgi:hypothetical protein
MTAAQLNEFVNQSLLFPPSPKLNLAKYEAKTKLHIRSKKFELTVYAVILTGVTILIYKC